jgi:hypothetical protein
MLQNMQHVYLSSCSESPLHVLARWTRIPAATRVYVTYGPPSEPAYLDITGWGQGWLPAMLANTSSSNQERAIVMATDDNDVDLYLSAVALMRPGKWQDCKHMLSLGGEVSNAGFSRLLGCAQQPALRLEVGSATRKSDHPWGLYSCMKLRPSYIRALRGLSAPQLVSLAVSGCEQVANQDVAMLARACHALRDLKLLGASKLSDPALYVLAIGCRQLERVQLTHANVTEDGVMVALAMLGQLQRLEVGGMPGEALEQLQVLVAKQLAAANCLQWVTAGPNADSPSATWSKQVGG